MYVCMYVFMYVRNTCVYVCSYVFMYLYIYVRMDRWIDGSIYVCIYVFIYVMRCAICYQSLFGVSINVYKYMLTLFLLSCCFCPFV